jgi:hypothetical protein
VRGAFLIAITIITTLASAAASPLSAPELQTLANTTQPLGPQPASAVGMGYNSFAQTEVGPCFDPPIDKDVTTETGVHAGLFYATTREDLYRQLRVGAAERFGLASHSASVFAAINAERLSPLRRFVVARIVVRGKGRRLTRNRGFVDGTPPIARMAPFVAKCGDKFAREIYPTASLTVLYVLTPATDDEAAAMDARAQNKGDTVTDGATLVAAVREIRGKAAWTAHAESIGWNRTVPLADFDTLARFTENFANLVADCRASGSVVCSSDGTIAAAARSGDPLPAGAFFIANAAVYDDYSAEVGTLDVGGASLRLKELSDHYTQLLDLRDAGSTFFTNANVNYWPTVTAEVHAKYDAEMSAALLGLRNAADACAASLQSCNDFDYAAADRLVDGDPFGDRYGVVQITDVTVGRPNQALGYIADGNIGLVDFLGTIVAPGGTPFRDARETGRVELRMRNAAAVVDDTQPIIFTGQTCIKGPATVIYWPAGQFYEYQTYDSRNFRSRIFIVDAKEQANLPKDTVCYSPK